jgi:hypothetical protein
MEGEVSILFDIFALDVGSSQQFTVKHRVSELRKHFVASVEAKFAPLLRSPLIGSPRDQFADGLRLQ